MKITAVVPCYNEQEALGLFYEELNRVTAEMLDCEFEILFVNDGSKDRTLELMKELAKSGMTMVVVTHEMGFAREVATRVLFIDDGKIQEQNAPKEFFENPQNPRLKEFLSKVL